MGRLSPQTNVVIPGDIVETSKGLALVVSFHGSIPRTGDAEMQLGYFLAETTVGWFSRWPGRSWEFFNAWVHEHAFAISGGQITRYKDY